MAQSVEPLIEPLSVTEPFLRDPLGSPHGEEQSDRVLVLDENRDWQLHLPAEARNAAGEGEESSAFLRLYAESSD